MFLDDQDIRRLSVTEKRLNRVEYELVIRAREMLSPQAGVNASPLTVVEHQGPENMLLGRATHGCLSNASLTPSGPKLVRSEMASGDSPARRNSRMRCCCRQTGW
jgi:hypothetical protein